MKKKKLTITLKSDLCAGSGFAYAGIIDSDVSFDKYGFPFISGRRIKGCIREAAELIGIENIEGIFGRQYAGEYEESSGLIVSDAYPDNMPEQDLLEGVFRNKKYKEYINQESVINKYTSIRTQTAIDAEKGIAKDNTLRFTRVVNKDSFVGKKPMCFKTEVFVADNYLETVENIVKATRNMGMDRNRGLGSIKMEIEPFEDTNKSVDITDGAENLKGEDRIEISYVIRNDAPLILSSDKDTISENYIPGYSVLGAFAKKYLRSHGSEEEGFSDLFLNGKTIYSNLNYAVNVKDKGKRLIFHEAPSYINKLKKTKKLVDTEVLMEKDIIFDDNDEYDYKDGNQPKKLNGKCLANKEGQYYIAEVEREIIYHHTKKSNKPEAKDANGNMLFFFDAISKGQYFAGKIETEAKYKEDILDILKDGTLYFGKSKSSQYGKCSVCNIEVAPASNGHEMKYQPGDLVLINLLSDAVFMDDAGNYTSDYNTVWQIIRDSINAEKDNPRKSYAKVKTICGYSGIWNLHKQELPVVRAGSSFAFIVGNSTSFPPYLGVKNHEGFGEYEISVHPDCYKLKEDYCTETPEDIGDNDILKAIYEEALLNQILNGAKEKAFRDEKIGITPSSLGRLNLMVIEAWNSKENSMDSFKDMLARVESIKSESTQKEIHDYLKGIFGKYKGNSEDELKNEIVRKINETNEEAYEELENLIGKPEACNNVFDMWYTLLVNILTVQKYRKKEDA